MKVKKILKTRDGSTATIFMGRPENPEFALFGHVDCQPHVWKENGSWREDDKPHPFDLPELQPA